MTGYVFNFIKRDWDIHKVRKELGYECCIHDTRV